MDRRIDEIAGFLAENVRLDIALEFLAEIYEGYGQLAAEHNMGWLCNLSHPQTIGCSHVSRQYPV